MSNFKDEISFLQAGGMNLDDDVRSMPKNDVLLVRNGRWGISYSGNVNAIERIKGMTKVSVVLPEGQNIVRGLVEDTVRKACIYVIYNSNGDHCICRYKLVSHTFDMIVYKNSYLQIPNYIFDIDIANNGEEGLLYWTDGKTRQKKLNIKEAREFTHTKYGSGIGFWVIEDDNIVT